MHLAEFALRDFINTEKFCHPGSVIVFDDMLPRHPDEAGRGREAGAARGAWAGDVYKVVDTLRTLRPDLIVLEIDTTPTGTLVVLVPDASSRALDNAYDDLVEQYVVPDPQKVPDWVLQRTRAMQGETLLSSPVWDQVRSLRERPADKARGGIREAYTQAELVTPS
jgi:hypothetical protein